MIDASSNGSRNLAAVSGMCTMPQTSCCHRFWAIYILNKLEVSWLWCKDLCITLPWRGQEIGTRIPWLLRRPGAPAFLPFIRIFRLKMWHASVCNFLGTLWSTYERCALDQPSFKRSTTCPVSDGDTIPSRYLQLTAQQSGAFMWAPAAL